MSDDAKEGYNPYGVDRDMKYERLVKDERLRQKELDKLNITFLRKKVGEVVEEMQWLTDKVKVVEYLKLKAKPLKGSIVYETGAGVDAVIAFLLTDKKLQKLAGAMLDEKFLRNHLTVGVKVEGNMLLQYLEQQNDRNLNANFVEYSNAMLTLQLEKVSKNVAKVAKETEAKQKGAARMAAAEKARREVTPSPMRADASEAAAAPAPGGGSGAAAKYDEDEESVTAAASRVNADMMGAFDVASPGRAADADDRWEDDVSVTTHGTESSKGKKKKNLTLADLLDQAVKQRVTPEIILEQKVQEYHFEQPEKLVPYMKQVQQVTFAVLQFFVADEHAVQEDTAPRRFFNVLTKRYLKLFNATIAEKSRSKFMLLIDSFKK